MGVFNTSLYCFSLCVNLSFDLYLFVYTSNFDQQLGVSITSLYCFILCGNWVVLDPTSSMASQKLEVLFLGHSFVRRLDNHLRSSSLANFSLPSRSHDVRFLGQSGAHVSDVMTLFQRREVDPHLVFLDIGTNDLTNLYVSTHDLATQVFNLARQLIQHYGVEHVVIMEVLPRTTWGRHGAPRSFSGRVRRFNDMIKALVCRFKMSLPVSFWFHKRIANDIDTFIADGVHLNSLGLARYTRSVRRAILKYSRPIRRTLAFSP